MKITKLSFALKGEARVIDLAPVTIITGKNMTGKTTILDAITLAIGGYIPRLGKSHAKLSPLIGVGLDNAFATAYLDSGEEIGWSLSRDASGALKKQHAATDSSQIIVDPEAFLSAKKSERIMAIQNALGLKTDLIAELSRGINPAWRSWKKDAGDWIEDTTEIIKMAVKAAKENRDRQIATIGAMAQHVGEAVAFNTETLSALRDAEIRAAKVHAVAEQRLANLKREEPVKLEPEDGDQIPVDHAALLKGLNDKLVKTREHNDLVMELNGAIGAKCPICGADHKHWDEERREEIEHRANSIRAELNGDTELHDEGGIAAKIEEMERRRDRRARLVARSAWEASIAEALSAFDAALAEYDAAKASRVSYENDTAKAAEQAASASLLRKCEQERDLAAKEVEDGSTALSGLIARINLVSGQIMGGVIKKAAPICAGLLPGPLISNGFDIGYAGQHGFVPMEAFSGMERIVATAAIQVALMTKDDPRILMIDEVQRIDASNLKILLKNIEFAITCNILDQAVLAGTGITQEMLPPTTENSPQYTFKDLSHE